MVSLMKKLKVKDYYSIIKMKNFTYFFLFIFLVSCTSNTLYQEPKNLIPKDTMQLLLTDMYIAAAAKNKKALSTKKKIKNLLPLVFLKYKIDSTRFNISNNYYTSSIEGYNDILENVEKNLKDSFTKFEVALAIKDSIKNQRRDINRKRNKINDSIKKEKEDIINGLISPLILRKQKIDTIRFYNNEFIHNNIKPYEGILVDTII